MRVNMSSYAVLWYLQGFSCIQNMLCPNQSISKIKSRKKLILNYLVQFHCIQLILENFLMNAGSSSHPTFYMKAMGQSLKSNVDSEKEVNPFPIKKCCVSQLTHP